MNQLSNINTAENVRYSKRELMNLFGFIASILLFYISLKSFTDATNLKTLVLSTLSVIGFVWLALYFLIKSILRKDAKIRKIDMMILLGSVFYEENLDQHGSLVMTKNNPKEHIDWSEVISSVQRYNLVARDGETVRSIMLIKTNETPERYGYRIIYSFENQEIILESHSYNSLCPYELIKF